ncbi:hypothetical protein CCAL_0030 [Campylobacter californiensis]|nr:hypothetical protein CCAL_0030 [Campylobacter sp. RM6914]
MLLNYPKITMQINFYKFIFFFYCLYGGSKFWSFWHGFQQIFGYKFFFVFTIFYGYFCSCLHCCYCACCIFDIFILLFLQKFHLRT